MAIDTRLAAYAALTLRVTLGVMYLAHSVILKLLTFGLPGTADFFSRVGLPGWPWRPFHVQNNRKLLRCQAMTVSGLTMTSDERQSFQTSHSHAHRNRSAGVSLGRFTERRGTPSWCRKARFSNWSAARDLKHADNVSATI